MKVFLNNFQSIKNQALKNKNVYLAALGITAGIIPLKKDAFEKSKNPSLSDLLGINYNNTSDKRILDIKNVWREEFDSLNISKTINEIDFNDEQKINFLHALVTPFRKETNSISISSINAKLNLSSIINSKLEPKNKDDISEIISKAHFDYQTERTNYAIEKLQSTKKISNPEIINYLKNLRSLEHPNLRADIVSDMMKYNYLTKDEALDLTKIPIGAKEIIEYRKNAGILNNNKELSLEQKNRILRERKFLPQELSKNLSVLSLIGKKELSKYDDKTTDAVLKFAPYYNKSNIQELSKRKKKDLVNLLVENNHLLFDSMESFHKKFPILPKNVSEYCDTITKLVSSIGINGKTLSAIQMKEYLQNVSELEAGLKNVDLNDEKMFLVNSHSDFVKNINSLLKGLSKSEKDNLTSSFGFKIDNNILNGHPRIYTDDFNNENLSKNKNIVDKMRNYITEYNTHNYIVVSKNKKLENAINGIAKYVPELYSLFDNENSDIQMLKVFQNLVNSKKYHNLSERDKGILKTAALLSKVKVDDSASQDEAFDSYYLAKRFNYKQDSLNKIHRIIEQQDFLNKIINSEDSLSEIRYSSFRLKDDNLLDLTLILSEAGDKSNIKNSKFISNIVKKYIKEIKTHDFILPQTPEIEIRKNSKEMNIRGFNVKVAYAKDIKDFYGFLHSPERVENTSNTRNLKIYTLDSFGVLDDNKVLCTSYVSSDKIGALAKFGFMMDVSPDNIHAGVGYDMDSPYRMDLKDLVKYYIFNTGRLDNSQREKTFEHRKYISEQLRTIMNIGEAEYIKRFEKIKHCTSLDEIGKIDLDFKLAYEKFLSIPCTNMLGDNKEKKGLLRDGDHWNEILVTNPTIKAVFSRDLQNTPDEYLTLASKFNIPIIVV